jgi:hypothetical protein
MGESTCLPCFQMDNADLKQDETLAYYAGYTEEEIEPVFFLMVDYLARPVIHEAFYKKYASKKFLKGRYTSVLKRIQTITNE